MVGIESLERKPDFIEINASNAMKIKGLPGNLGAGYKCTSKCFLRGMGAAEFLNVEDFQLEYIETFADGNDATQKECFAVNGNNPDDKHNFEENILNIYDFDSDGEDDDGDDRGESEEVTRAFQARKGDNDGYNNDGNNISNGNHNNNSGDTRLNPLTPHHHEFEPRIVHLDKRARHHEVNLDQTDAANPEGFNVYPEGFNVKQMDDDQHAAKEGDPSKQRRRMMDRENRGDDDNDAKEYYESFRRRNPDRLRRCGFPADDQFRPVHDKRKPGFLPDGPFRLSPVEMRRTLPSGPNSKPTNELTLHQKMGIRFFSPGELELQEKIARQQEKEKMVRQRGKEKASRRREKFVVNGKDDWVDEKRNENFELFKQLADLNFETEPVKEKYTLMLFLDKQIENREGQPDEGFNAK